MGDNKQQIEDWNGALGQRWVEHQEELDRLTRPFGEAALRAANPRPGERVIDVGCGCGDTSIALAKAVGASGSVLGVDVSAPMLALAKQRAAGLNQLEFREADASSADLPRDQDLLFSRFGVMFFAAPVPAFAHLRTALKASGRLAFVCWRAAQDNPWATVPLLAARNVVANPAPPPDPLAPGPFAFADDARLRAILMEARFLDVKIEPFESPVYLGSSPRSAAEGTARMGPLSRYIREVGEQHLGRIVDAVETALRPRVASDGSVSLTGRTWIVTAKAG